MKKLLLASAIAALSVTAAQAAPTVYGKAFLTLDVQDGDDEFQADETRTQLNSIASRLGVKGSEALTTNTDLVYQLEYRLDIDKKDGKNWESRDTYIGLANKQYGTLVAGRLSAIDDYINYANVTKGGVLGGDDVLVSWSGNRANNTFAYFSPEYNGVQFLGMYTLDENNDSDNLSGDAFGVGVKYEPANQPVKAGVTYIRAAHGTKVPDENNETVRDIVKDINTGDDIGYIERTVKTTDTTVGDFETLRVSGAYALPNGLTTIGAQYQLNKTDIEGAKKENSYTLSASHKIAQTPWTAYGQLDFVDNFGYDKDAEVFRTAIGGQYAFNKNTTAHVYGAYMREDGLEERANGSKVKADGYGVGAGIEYKF